MCATVSASGTWGAGAAERGHSAAPPVANGAAQSAAGDGADAPAAAGRGTAPAAGGEQGALPPATGHAAAAADRPVSQARMRVAAATALGAAAVRPALGLV
jgi:hypothetical protein